MNGLDLAKRDMTVTYGDRSFALRAYRDDGSWHTVIIENKTPLRNTLMPAPDAASCFAAAVHVVATAVDAAGSAPATGATAAAPRPAISVSRKGWALRTLSELVRTRRHDTIEAEIDTCGTIAPSTLDAIQSKEAAEAALQRQLRTGEMTQDDYDERWSSLVETTSPAVPKATMAR
jgi:2-oxoglutarate dehydrogenase complex dehydrogenase (E1) component-like enzyme